MIRPAVVRSISDPIRYLTWRRGARRGPSVAPEKSSSVDSATPREVFPRINGGSLGGLGGLLVGQSYPHHVLRHQRSRLDSNPSIRRSTAIVQYHGQSRHIACG